GESSLNNYFGVKTTILLGMFALVSCSAEQKAAVTIDADAKASVATQSDESAIEKFEAYTQRFSDATVITQNHATGHIGDFFFTHWKDGGAAALTMDTDGAFSVSWQGGGYNYVGGPGWHFGDKDRVI